MWTPHRRVAVHSTPTTPKKLEQVLQECGVVLSDPKKLLKKNSPLMQMWELVLAEQWLPAIKMSEQEQAAEEDTNLAYA